MEKDKCRSVNIRGMLVWSMLLLSALFIGCATNNVTVYPQPVCTHAHQAAFYHHAFSIPPHPPGCDTFRWYVEPPVNDSLLGKPIAMPCPIDGTLCQCDSVKCTTCGAKLWQP
jgi:hypothetical protein